MDDVVAVIAAVPELALLVLDDPDEQLLQFALLGLAPLDEEQPQPQPTLPLSFIIQQSQQAYGLPASGLTGGGGGAGSINWGAVLRGIPRITQKQEDYVAQAIEHEVQERVTQETQKQLKEILAKVQLELPDKDKPSIPKVSVSEGLVFGWKHAGLSGALGGALLADSLSDIIQAADSTEDRKSVILTGTNALLAGTIGAILIAQGYKKKQEK